MAKGTAFNMPRRNNNKRHRIAVRSVKRGKTLLGGMVLSTSEKKLTPGYKGLKKIERRAAHTAREVAEKKKKEEESKKEGAMKD
jgi:hypothetical protein